MKLTVLLLLCLALCGCERDKLSEVVRGVDVYDGCEYLCFRTTNYHWTHKGNCTNVIHGIIPSNSGGFWRYEGPTFQQLPGYIENSEPTKQ